MGWPPAQDTLSHSSCTLQGRWPTYCPPVPHYSEKCGDPSPQEPGQRGVPTGSEHSRGWCRGCVRGPGGPSWPLDPAMEVVGLGWGLKVGRSPKPLSKGLCKVGFLIVIRMAPSPVSPAGRVLHGLHPLPIVGIGAQPLPQATRRRNRSSELHYVGCPLGHPLWGPGTGDGSAPTRSLRGTPAREGGHCPRCSSSNPEQIRSHQQGRTLPNPGAPSRRQVQRGQSGWPWSDDLYLQMLRDVLVCQGGSQVDLTLSTGLRQALLVSLFYR